GCDAARQASTLEAEILDIILNATPSKGHDHD
ncbi:ABC transporter ATP-binding protein, partial [Mesorhizobium sp. M7A.T.Ca.TU.009.01.1.1]